MGLTRAEFESLQCRAQLWATGATVHDVRCLLGPIEMTVAGLKERWHRNPAMLRWVDQYQAVLVKTLEEFMAHGDYRKARRENPEPEAPREEKK
jgi:hypothetical protein